MNDLNARRIRLPNGAVGIYPRSIPRDLAGNILDTKNTKEIGFWTFQSQKKRKLKMSVKDWVVSKRVKDNPVPLPNPHIPISTKSLFLAWLVLTVALVVVAIVLEFVNPPEIPDILVWMFVLIKFIQIVLTFVVFGRLFSAIWRWVGRKVFRKKGTK